MIANSDPNGELGRRVAEWVARLGMPQRLLVPHGVGTPELPRAEVVEVGDGGEAGGLGRALADVETLFLVPMRERADRARVLEAMVDSAVRAGVRRIVYHSFVGAGPDATFTFARDHHATEQHIRASGVAFTFLRGGVFMEVLRYIVGDDGVIRGPAADGRFAPIARDDMARVTSVVLAAGDAHDGASYTPTGPERLSMADIAAAFTTATGSRVSYVSESIEEAYASRRAYGAPEWQVEGWVTTYLQVARGEIDIVTDHAERLTGRPPTTLSSFLQAHPESWPGS